MIRYIEAFQETDREILLASHGIGIKRKYEMIKKKTGDQIEIDFDTPPPPLVLTENPLENKYNQAAKSIRTTQLFHRTKDMIHEIW